MSSVRAAAAAIYRFAVALFFAGVVVQFFLAGLGVFRTQHDAGHGTAVTEHRFQHDFAAHSTLGFVLLVVGVVVALAAMAARLERSRRAAAVWLPVLVLLQSLFAGAGPAAFRALHPVNAIAIFALSGLLAHRAWRSAAEPA